MKPVEFINFIDYNKQLMNTKGGNKRNNYELIIITSVQKLEDIYKNIIYPEPRKQWERRVQVIDLYKKESIKLENIVNHIVKIDNNARTLVDPETTKDFYE